MTMPGSFTESVNAGAITDPAELARIERLYERILLETDQHNVSGRLIKVYTEALLDVAEKRNVADEIGEELSSLADDVFDKHPELESLLANPTVHRAAKKAIIDRAFSGRCTPLFEDFLQVLCRHDRLHLLRLIAVAYQVMRDDYAKRVRVLVESAAPLNKSQSDKLRQILREALKLEPILINRIRPELLGGLLLHIGDKVFDTTVLHKLETLRSQFLARGSHEIQTRRDRFSTNN
jgi:F-type H+-transporting ATPase subunit delta